MKIYSSIIFIYIIYIILVKNKGKSVSDVNKYNLLLHQDVL